MKYPLMAFFLVLGLAILMFSWSFTGQVIGDEIFVKRVVDGDTFVIDFQGKEEYVRLIGMDTPERGQHLFLESTRFLERLIEGKKVRLEKDISERDKYERLLRYAFIDGVFANLELVKEGYASVLLYEPDTKYAEELLQEESKARESGIGIWSFPEGDFCMSIFSFHYNARGNDNENLNDEYVVFRNKCSSPVSLKGWMVKDKSGMDYVFPYFTIDNKTTVTLRTGFGTDNETDLFWGKTRAVWNNNGDSLLAMDSSGRVKLNYTYPY